MRNATALAIVLLATAGCLEPEDRDRDRLCGPVADGACRADEFCDFGDDVCLDDLVGATGVCRPRPEVCAEIYAPVCSCDGTTFANECEAHAAGEDVAYVGECEEERPCGPIADGECEPDELCLLEEGACASDALGHVGICVPLPTACAEIYAPVCGCDLNTYENECSAHAAGVSVLHAGHCAESSSAS